jgi:hypothetical protein
VTRSLFLAIPVYQAKVHAFERSMREIERTCQRIGIPLTVQEIIGDSLIMRARNRLVAQFMKSGCDDFLFIDSDIEFRPTDVLRLRESGYKLCAAPYPAKEPGGRLIGVPLQGGEIRDGWCPAQDMPTGFMLVAREVFEALAQHTEEVDDDIAGGGVGKYRIYFDTAVHNRQYLSEDWAFSRFARQHGFEPMLDMRSTLKHWGLYGFSAPTLEERMTLEAVSDARGGPVKPEPQFPPGGGSKEPGIFLGFHILHGPGEARQDAFERLVTAIGPENHIWEEVGPGPEHAFNGRRWHRALDMAKKLGHTHCAFLDDDVLTCPDFVANLRKVIAAQPERVIGLHHPHGSMCGAAYQMTGIREVNVAGMVEWCGNHWVTTSDGVLGPANVIPTYILEKFLEWRASALLPGALEAIDSDVLLGLFCLEHNVKVYHPIPTITDHDLTIATNFAGNEKTRGRATQCNWKTYPLPESWSQRSEPEHLGSWFGPWCSQNARWLKRPSSDPIISPTGFWTGPNVAAHHAIDPGLAKWIAGYLSPNRLVRDLGCGTGGYLKVLAEHGFSKLVGYDGEVPHPRLFGNVQRCDLTVPQTWHDPSDTICLEVAEHVPAEHEAQLLDNICSSVEGGGRLVLSWAKRGQAGHGHVNCKDNSEVIYQMSLLDFHYLDRQTQEARKSVTTLPWFRDTLMVFEKGAE